MRDTIDMAREAGFELGKVFVNGVLVDATTTELKAFEALVRADERKQIALDKKAENARELGLDYEPVLKDNSNYRYDPPVAEPVAYLCENAVGHKYFRWKKPSSEFKPIALYTIPPAQPAPVQEPVAWICYGAPGKRDIDFEEADIDKLPIGTLLYTSPPAAQRQWVGLTFAEICECENDYLHLFARAIEAKLKKKNTP